MSTYMRQGDAWKPVQAMYQLFSANAAVPIWVRAARVWRVAGATWRPEATPPAAIARVSSPSVLQTSGDRFQPVVPGQPWDTMIQVTAENGCQSAAFWYRTDIDPPGRWVFHGSVQQDASGTIQTTVTRTDRRSFTWCVTAFAGPVATSRTLPAGPQGLTLFVEP